MHYLSHPYNCVLGLMRCSVSIVWHMAEGPWELEQIKEATYTRKRFKWWKKAPKYFEEHQQSKCNTIATVYHVVGPRCKDIAELMRENLNVERAKERYLLDVRAWDIWMGTGYSTARSQGWGQFYATDGSSWSKGRKHMRSLE